MTTCSHKYLINFFGFAVVVISLYFVGDKIWHNKLWIVDWRPTKSIVLFMLFGSVLYGLNSFFLAIAWQKLLVWFGESSATLGRCYVVYARSQIAKYIPGNVIHVAGRHLLGRNLGFDHGPLVGAAIFEIIGLTATSSFVALLGMMLYGEMPNNGYGFSMAAVFVVALITPLIISVNMHKIPMLRMQGFRKQGIADIAVGLSPAFALYTAFFLIVGGILFGVANSVTAIINIDHFGIIITTFAFSWIAGFVTPGSPAGAGVREAIIIFSLNTIMAEPECLLIALLFRLITVVGDLLFFLGPFIFRPASSL